MQLSALIRSTWFGFGREFQTAPLAVAHAPRVVHFLGEHLEGVGGRAVSANFTDFIVVGARQRHATAPVALRVVAEDTGERFEWRREDAPPAEGWQLLILGCFVVWQEYFSRRSAMDLLLKGAPKPDTSLSVAALKAMATLTGEALEDRVLAELVEQVQTRFMGWPGRQLEALSLLWGDRPGYLEFDRQYLHQHYSPESLSGLSWVMLQSEGNSSIDYRGNPDAESLLESLRSFFPDLKSWQDLTEDQLPLIAGAPILQQQAASFLAEQSRVADFGRALKTGDGHALGLLLDAHHESRRQDWGIVAPESEFLQEFANGLEGCLGGRGRGDSGSLHLVRSDAVELFLAALLPRFGGTFGKEAHASVLRLAAGAGVAGTQS